MNNKITLPQIINLLAEQTELPRKTCESFISEFFNTVINALESGDNVTIKNIGTFKILKVEERKSVDVNTGEDIIIPSHKKVTFVPTKELADAINAPFSMFDSVELDDNIDIDSIMNADLLVAENNPTPIPENKESDEHGNITPVPESIEQEDNKTVSIPEVDQAGQQNQTSVLSIDDDAVDTGNSNAASNDENGNTPSTNLSQNDPTSEGTDINTVKVVNPPINTNSQDGENNHQNQSDKCNLGHWDVPEPKPNRKRFAWGFASGIACMAVIGAIAYFIFIAKPYEHPQPPEVTTSNDSLLSDSALTGMATVEPVDTPTSTSKTLKDDKENDVAPTPPSDITKYDTVTEECFLTTLAQKYYGNFNLWPIIYEENKDILGHPDKIRPGTKVAIPELSKYGINPKNRDDVKKVKAKGVEIYKKYKG